MKIALIAPCPVPYAVGGAQRLWWGWADYMNAHTAHAVELLQIPSPEHDFFSVVRSYERFFNLNLDHFDRVVSGKYPAWMVQHRDHRVYMLHRLRGLYDTYGAQDAAASLPAHDDFSLSRDVLTLSAQARANTRADIAQLFTLVAQIDLHGGAERARYTFPGPLAKLVVQTLDGFALSTNRVASFAALSKTVRDRRDYFPVDAEVEVIYPPTAMPNTASGNAKHFLAASRFDGPKRMDLIISAFKKTTVDMPLKMIGEGPTLAACKALAQSDRRIEFLGFVPDQTLATLYSDALATLFVPQDEDYGLVTLESFTAARPVITATDSGGPCELVKHGYNGWVVEPTVAAVSGAITAAASDVTATLAKGRQGAVTASAITWAKLSDWTARAQP